MTATDTDVTGQRCVQGAHGDFAVLTAPGVDQDGAAAQNLLHRVDDALRHGEEPPLFSESAGLFMLCYKDFIYIDRISPHIEAVNDARLASKMLARAQDRLHKADIANEETSGEGAFGKLGGDYSLVFASHLKVNAVDLLESLVRIMVLNFRAKYGIFEETPIL